MFLCSYYSPGDSLDRAAELRAFAIMVVAGVVKMLQLIIDTDGFFVVVVYREKRYKRLTMRDTSDKRI